MLSVLQSYRFPSGVQGQKRRLQAHRPTHLKWALGEVSWGTRGTEREILYVGPQ